MKYYKKDYKKNHYKFCKVGSYKIKNNQVIKKYFSKEIYLTKDDKYFEPHQFSKGKQKSTFLKHYASIFFGFPINY